MDKIVLLLVVVLKWIVDGIIAALCDIAWREVNKIATKILAAIFHRS